MYYSKWEATQLAHLQFQCLAKMSDVTLMICPSSIIDKSRADPVKGGGGGGGVTNGPAHQLSIAWGGTPDALQELRMDKNCTREPNIHMYNTLQKVE